MKKIRWLLPLCLLLILSVAACGRGEEPTPEATATPTVQSQAAETPREIAETATPTATSAPTDTPAPTETPTATTQPVSVMATPISPLTTPDADQALQADPCEEELTGNDAQIAQQFPALGCPEGPANFIYMARQPFQNGQMIWREDEQIIYVLHNDGHWLSFEDTFTEGDPEKDPGLTPPQGLFQPIRGFGKIWREALNGPDAAIGWATLPEQGTNASVQEWENGVLFSFGLPDRFVLFQNGRWEQIE